MNTIPAANHIVAEYEFPFLAHTPMEPLNTTIRFDGDHAEVWAGSQFQTVDQGAAAQIAGVPPEAVSIHTPFLGGGFGRPLFACTVLLMLSRCGDERQS